MADPHRTDRYGQLWPQHKIGEHFPDLIRLRDLVVVSGGWAWHLMSPAGHAEYKHAHDHKDIDAFVAGPDVAALHGRLFLLGYKRVATQHDRKKTAHEFHRYERVGNVPPHPPFRLTIDLFVGSPPSRHLEGGWRVVDPAHLISLYKTIHGSDTCLAVKAASRLLAAGVDPVGHPDLAALPQERSR